MLASAFSWLSSTGSSTDDSSEKSPNSFPLADIHDGPLGVVASFLNLRDALSFTHTCSSFYSLNVWVEIGASRDILIPADERKHPAAALATVLRAVRLSSASDASGFVISWGDDLRYWNRSILRGSFGPIARCLDQVWWFDMKDETGKLTARGSGTHFVFLSICATAASYALGILDRRVWALSEDVDAGAGAGAGAGGASAPVPAPAPAPARFGGGAIQSQRIATHTPALAMTHDWPRISCSSHVTRATIGSQNVPPLAGAGWVLLPIGSLRLKRAPGDESSHIPSRPLAFSLRDVHGTLKHSVAFSHAIVVHRDDLTSVQKESLRWGNGQNGDV